MTRNHYLHDFFPGKLAYASCDGDVPSGSRPRARMVSQQGPRSVRLANEKKQRALEHAQERLEQKRARTLAVNAHPDQANLPVPTIPVPADEAARAARRASVVDPEGLKQLRDPTRSTQGSIPIADDFAATAPPAPATTSANRTAPVVNRPESSLPPLEIKCQVRTRIPTPHGHVFLYLYSNNHDTKEHLAFVADQAQMDAQPGEVGPRTAPFLRSASLDAVWHDGESDMERIVRGAYVGRLSATAQNVSKPGAPSVSRRGSASSAASSSAGSVDEREPPLVRIHSECFTGEVIGSQRCDCGEQLDEAFRLITKAQRGVVVYLRQEGRGIGLLEKMRAYNLQDLGHDTVTANLMLGHGADMRTYDIAGAILHDLAVPEVRLLTNNPDKIDQIEKEGVRVIERVAMVPRAWLPKRPSSKGKRPTRSIMSGSSLLQVATDKIMSAAASSATHSDAGDSPDDGDDFEDGLSDLSAFSDDDETDGNYSLRHSGVGMIGGATTRSPELEKYLRTKIERMGHMLEAPPPTPVSEPGSRAQSPAAGRSGKRAPVSRTASHNGPHPLSASMTSLPDKEEA